MTRSYRSFWPGVILILLGIIFLLDNLGVANSWQIFRSYWPVILILVGIGMLIKTSARTTQPEGFAQPKESSHVSGSVGDTIFESSVFGNISIRPMTKNFKGGNLSTVFGSIDLNLTGVELAPGEHYLGLNSLFGSIRVTLPREIPICVRSNSFLGEITVYDQKKGGIASEIIYTSPDYGIASTKMRIGASQVFGDIKIW